MYGCVYGSIYQGMVPYDRHGASTDQWLDMWYHPDSSDYMHLLARRALPRALGTP